MMKKILGSILLGLTSMQIFAQVAINSDGSDPHPSAMLEVTSNQSGILIPRMTAAQRDAIPSPAIGLMVYVTEDNLFHYYNGTAWTAIGVPQWTPANGAIHHNAGRVGIGTDNPDSLLHLSSATASEATGYKLTQGSANSLIYHNDGNDLVIRKLSEVNQLVLDTGGNVGIGTDAPSQVLDVNGQVRIRGGSPSAGKVLTATDSNGNASWSTVSPELPADSTELTNNIARGDSGTGWDNTSARAQLDGLSNGDVILVIASFRMQLSGGSGTDTTRFRIRANNISLGTGVNQYTMDTGELTYLNRGEWYLYTLHRLITINQGAGNYRFYVEVDESLTDDTLNFNQQAITAIKL